MLSDSYDAISRALAAPAASSGHITDPRQLQQSADAALLDILLSVVSATVGDQGLELPWKCFVCVVTLSMLLPLATNLALQVLVRPPRDDLAPSLPLFGTSTDALHVCVQGVCLSLVFALRTPALIRARAYTHTHTHCRAWCRYTVPWPSCRRMIASTFVTT
jgi:hypothetical protein